MEFCQSGKLGTLSFIDEELDLGGGVCCRSRDNGHIFHFHLFFISFPIQITTFFELLNYFSIGNISTEVD